MTQDETRRKEGPIHTDNDRERFTIGDCAYTVCSSGERNSSKRKQPHDHEAKSDTENGSL